MVAHFFFYFNDASVVQAFVLYNELGLPKLSMKDFRKEIIRYLTAKTIVKNRRPKSTNVVAIKKKETICANRSKIYRKLPST